MSAVAPLPWLQETLSSLTDGNQLAFVLRRIAGAIDGGALLYNRAGELVASIGQAPERLVWEGVARIHQTEAAPHPFHVGRWRCDPVRTGPGGRQHHLVVTQHEASYEPIASELFTAFDVAVTAAIGAIRGADTRRIFERAQLLESLERGIPTSREARYWTRLAEFGFIPRAPVRLVVGISTNGTALDNDQTRHLIRDAEEANIPILFASRIVSAASDAEFHAIIPATDTATAWLQRHLADTFLGQSDSHSALADIPRATREAELAHHVAVEYGEARLDAGIAIGDVAQVVNYRELSLRHWLAAEAPPVELRARRRRLLRVFDGHDELLHTLIVHLAHGLEVAVTAKVLYLHPNTVRYRLSRVEDLLGESLRSPQLLTDLTLCLEPRVHALQASAGEPVGLR